MQLIKYYENGDVVERRSATLTMKASPTRKDLSSLLRPSATASHSSAAAALDPVSWLSALLAVNMARRIVDAVAGVHALGRPRFERICHETGGQECDNEKSRNLHGVYYTPA